MKIDQAGSDPLLGQMERALDVMSRRQGLLASNVANLDTPNYKTQDVDFNASLAGAVETRGTHVALRRTRPEHAAGTAGSGAVQDKRALEALPQRNDGNNVNLDREMLALAETRGRYEAATAFLRYRLRQLKSAVSDGRSA